jgi:hypothetical protein
MMHALPECECSDLFKSLRAYLGVPVHLDRTDLDENRVRDPYPIVRRIFYWLSYALK